MGSRNLVDYHVLSTLEGECGSQIDWRTLNLNSLMALHTVLFAISAGVQTEQWNGIYSKVKMQPSLQSVLFIKTLCRGASKFPRVKQIIRKKTFEAPF